MGWTKGAIVDEALGELSLAGHTFDVSPEERQAALRRLEALMGTWSGKGVNIGYRFAVSPESVDPDEDSGLPLFAVETTFLHLAERIAASYGKQLSATTRATARDGYDRLVVTSAMPRMQQIAGGIPLGAGHKTRGDFRPAFTSEPDAGPLQVAEDGGLIFGG